VLERGEDFVVASSGTIGVCEASDSSNNVFALLKLAADLRLERVSRLCAGKLSALPAAKALSYLTAEWAKTAGPDALLAAVLAIKACK
jgi:hypothetical protein